MVRHPCTIFLQKGTYMKTGEMLFFAPGEVICKQGDPGDFVLIILMGTATVEIFGRQIAVVSEEQSVGEMAVMTPDGRRSATVQAKTEVVAGKIDRAAFLHLLDEAPPEIQTAFKTLVLRMTEMTQAKALEFSGR